MSAVEQKNARNVIKSTVMTFVYDKFVFQLKKVIQIWKKGVNFYATSSQKCDDAFIRRKS